MILFWPPASSLATCGWPAGRGLLRLGASNKPVSGQWSEPVPVPVKAEQRRAGGVAKDLDGLTPSDHLDNEEEYAIREIDAAINEIKQASIDDGKNLSDHPSVDAHLDRKGRYHKTLELLDKAHHEVSEKEDDQFAQGFRHLALEHIDGAYGIVDRLIIQTSGN